MEPLQVNYLTTEQAYKNAVDAKDKATAITLAQKLGSICTAQGKLAPSGDSTIDTEVPQHASSCAAGWADIVAAYQKNDKSLLTEGHAQLATATAHFRAYALRFATLGQSLTQ